MSSSVTSQARLNKGDDVNYGHNLNLDMSSPIKNTCSANNNPQIICPNEFKGRVSKMRADLWTVTLVRLLY